MSLGPLHTVNKSPFSSNALEDCLKRMDDEAALLLIEDGVYAALDGSAAGAQLTAAGHPVYALGPDLAARGLAGRPLAKGVTVVDYPGFVDLAARHSSVVAWF